MYYRHLKLLLLLILTTVTLSCNRGSNMGTDNNTLSDSPLSQGGKSSMTGTWSGNINCQPGGSVQAVYRVSGNGYPIYDYQTKSGAREAELNSTGQVVRFVPPGGGVADVRVDSLSVAPDRISYTLSISEERTSMDTLDQNKAVVNSEARLTGAGLEVEMTVRAQGIASQPGMVVPGEESNTRCRGTLQKQ